ncbi:MAG TPA: AAA family ATPase [Candidatus Paceibacterota bacterium]
MKISKVEINNFKSIEKASFSASDFTVLIGQNNHGKTNVLSAIEWFYNGAGKLEEIVHRSKDKKDISVVIEFTDIESGLEHMKNEKNKTTLTSKLNGANTARIIARVSDKDKQERLLWDPSTEEYITTGTGANNFLNDFLPTLQFVKTSNHLKDVAKYGPKTEIGLMLGSVVNEILYSEDEEYKEFVRLFNRLFGDSGSLVGKKLKTMAGTVESYLKVQFPECDKVEFSVSNPKLDELLKNFEVDVDDGHNTPASDKGDGMQRALMLAIFQTYAEHRRESEGIKNFLFIIDEAELHLHPTAQRNLKKALLELATGGDQVFISTHSSVLIADECKKQTVLRVQKTEKKTDVEPVVEGLKKDVVYDLLGGSPADLLLPANFILVEGTSDRDFLSLVIDRHYPDKKNIQVIPVWGDIEKVDRVFEKLAETFAPLNATLYADRVVILVDKISEEKLSKYQEFRRKYPGIKDEQVIELSVASLEEYYPIARPEQVNGHNHRWQESVGHNLTSRQKQTRAKNVGKGIEKEQFEEDMPLVHKALTTCWDNAY